MKQDAPRAEGKCQAKLIFWSDGSRTLKCLECGFECEGMPTQELVDKWNNHIIYR